MHARLAAMMFMLYFAAGAILPIMSHYLKNHLGFEPFQVGVVLAMPAVAAMVSPFWVALVADRKVSAERLLALCQLAAGGFMLVLAWQTTFWPFLLIYMAHACLFMPCMGLTNTVTFHHATDGKRHFAPIRAWGTAGWFAVAWCFGYFWLQRNGDVAESRLPDALYVCAATCAILGVYAFTLPRRFKPRDEPEPPRPADSLRVFLRPGLLVLCVLTLINGVLMQFYSYGAGPYLSAAGLGDEWILPALSVGQLTEMGVMAIMAFWLARYSIKTILVAGMVIQCFRFGIFAITDSPWLILIGISLHGFCYAFYFVTAYIYLDSHCRPQERAGAQQVYHIISAGLGMLIGGLSAGWAGEFATDAATGALDYQRFWLVAVVMSVAVTCVAVAFFKEGPPVARDTEAEGGARPSE